MKKIIIDNKLFNLEEPNIKNKYNNWIDKNIFLNKLKQIEKDIPIRYDKYYILNKITWEKTFGDYIDKNNIKPSDIFIDYIYRYKIKQKKEKIKFKGTYYLKDKEQSYVKFDRNQILILDALLKHGGHTKKYFDNKSKIYRYSEHSGYLDFSNSNMLEKIIISGNTVIVDKMDKEIFLPNNMPDALDFEYIFHTHPPTPKPGGRVDGGILYEIPSKSDLFHFIAHYNLGETQGSIILAAEGMYIISSLDPSNKIKLIDEKKFNYDVTQIFRKIQEKNIKKYGIKFNTEFFYSIIAQDLSFINDINSVLNKYKIHIYYYPRVKKHNEWIIDTVYLPIHIIEPIH